MSHSTRLAVGILTAWLISVLMLLFPALGWADAFFCDHHIQVGKERRTPEVVITSEGESIQQGAVLSVRCHPESIDGLKLLLVIHGKDYRERRPVLRFAGRNGIAHFSALPSRLGNAFYLPNNHEQEVLGLLNSSGDPLVLEIYSGDQEKDTYTFQLTDRSLALLQRLPCNQKE